MSRVLSILARPVSRMACVGVALAFVAMTFAQPTGPAAGPRWPSG